ncbi:TetR/AcrR family transcriptional regulator [Hoeflea prorocentri]|uniref:TetR/AcrR family transcriptional regulator n=1 Tax=Hoeflea prorocentri TaxID=1922333 RepID=A0A9X3UIZ2_9HYPH|nr:TetR/AcrR family transcriptional regulator [Hoeflea prorocentri]MCY6381534.1 TetR/AcrR family transcriptional regulator [Hoeflea prorocentri]MDA5399334.1 TetR/AcrR family transcriptional regulator [Hoeflea prorocentri]
MPKAAETRVRRSQAKILAAAEATFLHNGFLGTSMDAVADQAGVSKQTVYSNFGSKEALFLRVVHEMTGAAAAELLEIEPECTYPVSARDYFYSASVAQLNVVMTPRLMRLRRMVIGEVERFPELGRELHKHGPKPSINKFARAISHYQLSGQLIECDPAKAATHYNWLLMGEPVNAAMLLGEAGLPTKTQMRAHTSECVELFFNAYGTLKSQPQVCV